MNEIQLTAPAKINLALDITGKRPDGYHQVRMIMQSVSLADDVLLKKTNREQELTTNALNIPRDEKNIALKAWLLLKSHFCLPGGLKIHLEKRIPVEGGLAGGSANAAAVLIGVNKLYDLRLDLPALADLGVRLGADVPFCVFGGTALAEGIGEVLTPLPSPPKLWAVLVNPGFGVSTAGVYRGYDRIQTGRHPDIPAMVQSIRAGNTQGIMGNLGNVLESVTLKMHPELEALKRTLKEMKLAPLMTGSGPTVFALTDIEDNACRAAEILRDKWKHVVVVCTK